MCFDCIVEQYVDDVQYLLFQVWIEQWCCYFNMIINIVCYLVGGRKVDLFIVVIFKNINLVMFKVMVNNIDGMNVVVNVFQIGDQ